MPGWHAKLADAVKNGDIVMLGVTQEQHPERCELFAQWQQFNWPILHDPINLLGLRAVPVPILIDEYGVVRDTRPRTSSVDEFIGTVYPAQKRDVRLLDPAVPDLAKMLADVKQSPAANKWRSMGDAFVLWGGSSKIEAAVSAYKESLRLNAKSGATNFRLGVAYRMNHERQLAQEAERAGNATVVSADKYFELAVEHWGRALELDPNHYIYRRRIQQYGPRLTKPYPFYDWIDQAKSEIKARGEKPVQLPIEPTGAEIAMPSRVFTTIESAAKSPDPQGLIIRDSSTMIEISSVVVPKSVKSGGTGRVHVSFEPKANVHWNNEAEPLRVWLEAPEGWKLQQHLLKASTPKSAESHERRTIEFEVQSPRQVSTPATLKGYALYYICEDSGGQCLYRRQDFVIKVKVD